jgi:hypothetical protein
MGGGNGHTNHFNAGGMGHSSVMAQNQVSMDMNLMDAPISVPDAGGWGNFTGDFVSDPSSYYLVMRLTLLKKNAYKSAPQNWPRRSVSHARARQLTYVKSIENEH